MLSVSLSFALSFVMLRNVTRLPLRYCRGRQGSSVSRSSDHVTKASRQQTGAKMEQSGPKEVCMAMV